MKKITLSYVFSFSLVLLSVVSSAQMLDRECINANSAAQTMISDKNALFTQLKSQLATNVQNLIQQESITTSGNMLSFENLASLVLVATTLETYDKQYDDAYLEYSTQIAEQMWEQVVCVGNMTLNQYKEQMYDYLEDEKFSLTDEYASTLFAQQLNFQSALLKINADEENWLIAVGENFTSDNPAFDQVVENELYWPVLSESWEVDLRNPEAELSAVTGYSKIWRNLREQANSFDSDRYKGGPSMFANQEGLDWREILTFIFNNWDTIEDILTWLSQNITYDCHASTGSSVANNHKDVPSTMSPDKPRRIYYHIRQKGVFGDFKSTKTKIEGKVKLYKKREATDIKKIEITRMALAIVPFSGTPAIRFLSLQTITPIIIPEHTDIKKLSLNTSILMH